MHPRRIKFIRRDRELKRNLFKRCNRTKSEYTYVASAETDRGLYVESNDISSVLIKRYGAAYEVGYSGRIVAPHALNPDLIPVFSGLCNRLLSGLVAPD